MRIGLYDWPCDSAASILGTGNIVTGGLSRLSDAAWVRLTPLNKHTLDYCRNLKYVACPCTGLDHIDLAECERRGIRVLSLRDTDVLPTITATAEHTIGLILALVRKIPVAVESTKNGEWDRSQFMGRELSGRHAYILGVGRIGRMVAHRLRAFGVSSSGMSRDFFELQHGRTWKGSMLEDSDIVTVHVDLNDSTLGMCNAEFFAAMKPGGYFVNTSRGQVVDEAALLAALKSGHLAGAALDVVCGESRDINQELIRFANQHPDKLILTPHIGGYCVESLEKAECALARKLIEVVNG